MARVRRGEMSHYWTEKVMTNVYIVEGDTVRFHFPHYREEHRRDVIGEVLKVKERFLHYGNGRKAGRVVTYCDLETGEVTGCDEELAVELIHRPAGRRPRKVNRFAVRRGRCLVDHPRRGVIQGRLPELVSYVLGSLQLELTMSLCEERVYELYARQRYPGFIPGGGHGLNHRVRTKPFKSWVRRNASRLLETRAEVDARNTQRELEYAADYRRGVKQVDEEEANRLDLEPHRC